MPITLENDFVKQYAFAILSPT